MIEGGITMRKTLIFGLAAAGIGLAGASGASAVPVNGAVIGDLATATDHVTTVQHWRWRSGGHWRGGDAGGALRRGGDAGPLRGGAPRRAKRVRVGGPLSPFDPSVLSSGSLPRTS